MKEKDFTYIREKYNLKSLAVYQDGIVFIEGLISIEELLKICEDLKNVQSA